MDEHDAHLTAYDSQRIKQETENVQKMDVFLEKLKPFVDLKIDDLIEQVETEKSETKLKWLNGNEIQS